MLAKVSPPDLRRHPGPSGFEQTEASSRTVRPPYLPPARQRHGSSRPEAAWSRSSSSKWVLNRCPRRTVEGLHTRPGTRRRISAVCVEGPNCPSRRDSISRPAALVDPSCHGPEIASRRLLVTPVVTRTKRKGQQCCLTMLVTC